MRPKTKVAKVKRQNIDETMSRIEKLLEDGRPRVSTEIREELNLHRNGLFANAMKKLQEEGRIATCGTRQAGPCTRSVVYGPPAGATKVEDHSGTNPFLWRTYQPWQRRDNQHKASP